jgi:hypothetical protein
MLRNLRQYVLKHIQCHLSKDQDARSQRIRLPIKMRVLVKTAQVVFARML